MHGSGLLFLIQADLQQYLNSPHPNCQHLLIVNSTHMQPRLLTHLTYAWVMIVFHNQNNHKLSRYTHTIL